MKKKKKKKKKIVKTYNMAGIQHMQMNQNLVSHTSTIQKGKTSEQRATWLKLKLHN